MFIMGGKPRKEKMQKEENYNNYPSATQRQHRGGQQVRSAAAVLPAFRASSPGCGAVAPGGSELEAEEPHKGPVAPTQSQRALPAPGLLRRDGEGSAPPWLTHRRAWASPNPTAS